MANLYDRMQGYNMADADYVSTIDPDQLCHFLDRYVWGKMTASDIKTCYSMSTQQGNDLDDVLATMPNSILSTVNAVNKACWAARIASCVWGAGTGNLTYATQAAFKADLGV